MNSKLHVMKPFLWEWESARHRECFHERVLCRLRIGHMRLTHNFLLRGEDPLTCEYCDETLTVLRKVITCPKHESERRPNFPLIYKEHIPMHPALFLRDEPLVPFAQVMGLNGSSSFRYT